MKRMLSLIVLSVFLGVSSGYAETFWVGAVQDGLGGTLANVMGFDWASSGSGNAQGVGPGGTPLAPGVQFTFRYQSFLFSFTDPNGQVISSPGLTTSYEYTVVAQFPETVASVTPVGPTTVTAIFKTLPGGTFYIYNDTAVNSNVASGFGFDDGTLVASGTIDPDQFSSFTFDSASGSGLGSSIITGAVTYVNPNFLIPSTIAGFRFEGLLNIPPLESKTSSYFAGRAGEGNLATYPVAANDLNFKVDGSSKFILAPPPTGNCRVTAGGIKDGLTVPCALKANGLPDPTSCAQTGADTWGGQAGAQPGIDGNWTHHHAVSSKQSFVFHSNNLFFIGCSDPGCCVPACANADNRQIDFSGIGSFSNQKGYTPALPGGDLCFMVHLEDLGEPGPGGRWPSATAPCTHCPGTPIEPGDCVNCTDYYEILIFDSAAHDAAGKCTGNLIYYNGPGAPQNCTVGEPNLFGYFTRSGNVQMHPPNN